MCCQRSGNVGDMLPLLRLRHHIRSALLAVARVPQNMIMDRVVDETNLIDNAQM